MMAAYQYDAFISYRHRPVDQSIAVALQNRLERIKGPDGKKLKIFRDKTDLPISGDLSDGIQEALETSRFLIVVCSPEYRNSKWCMAELLQFRQRCGNSNDRILPVLVEGEPEDSFPAELFWEEERFPGPDGTEQIRRVELEPLGADVRGDTSLGRLWKLRTEYLRLASRILGKSFDELYQRDKRKQRWIWGSVITAVILGLTGFSLYNMHMRDRIQTEHQAMLAKESLRLAVASEQQLQQGNIKLAMALALEALPEDPEAPDRPLVAEAQTALRSAVYTAMAQQQNDLLQHITTIPFGTWGWSLRGIFAEGTVLAVNDLERMYLYDTSNGNLLFDYPSDFFAEAVLNRDATCVARVAYGGMEDGQQIYEGVVCRIPTGEVLFRETWVAEPYEISAQWDTETDICYFTQDLYVEEEFRILAAVKTDGTCIDSDLTAEDLQDPRFWDLVMAGFSPAMHTARDKTGWTELGETYRDVLEPVVKQSDGDVHISEDLALVQVSGGLREPDRFYSLPGLLSGNQSCVQMEGYYSLDTENRLLVVSDTYELRLYRYQPENLQFREPTELRQIRYMNDDGSRCLFEGSSGIWDSQDLSAPLLKPEGHCTCVTPDLVHMLVQPREDCLQLWSTEMGLLMELETPLPIINSCANGEATLLAVQLADYRVHIYDRKGNPVMTVEPPRRTDGWNEVLENLTVMELVGTDLLLCGNGNYADDECSWIVDTTGQRETVVIPTGGGCECYYHGQTAHHLTEDGLLMSTGDYFSDALDAIYDVKTGQCVFRQVAYYQYHAATGTLLYMPTNPQFGDSPVLHVARRNETGVFQDLYTVSPENHDTNLWRAVVSRDADYFIVMGQDCCQVYNLEDGTRLLTLYDSELAESASGRPFFMLSGTLYDTQYDRSGHLTCYEMAEFDQVLAWAREQLTSETGIRTLSWMEKEKFFLSE